ncbi:hypothetical protein OPIT5_16690 [Opitutaceae bacterium TAV5]|nr:hypothetical protein OPIT5_16690 [Opitutaceae bacterium TAV5]
MLPAIAGIASSLFGGGDAAAPGNVLGGSINIGSKVVGSGKATTTQDVPAETAAATAAVNWSVLAVQIGIALAALVAAGMLLFALLRGPTPSRSRKKKG